MLPLPVLEKAAAELVEYGDSGMSVMEMSHRSKPYEKIITGAEASLRSLMNVPDNYRILFLQGGASLQFCSVPLNLMVNKKADYILSGQFSTKAFKEGQKYGDAAAIASSKDKNFTYIPQIKPEDVRPDADYLHICFNNTIYMSSCILSEPVDVSKFGLIYAGAQKNVAPAGLTIVIVREDLIGHAREDIPAVMDYKIQADNGSMYNTPPCWPIYIAGMVFDWVAEMGGLEAMKAYNEKKAAVLYDYLDSQSYYIAPVEKEYRSMMNVTFVTGDAELDAKFASEAAAAGLKNVKGHRSVGGMRASIYNAMPIEGVKTLVAFMEKFAKENPKG